MVKEDSNKKSNIKKTTTNSSSSKKSTSSAKKPSSSVKKDAPKKVEEKKVEIKKEEVKKVQISSEEELSYTKTILAAVLIILVLVGGYIGYQIKNDGDKKSDNVSETYTPTADEKRFKEEYESINGTARSSGAINKTISIMDDNNIEYIDIDKAADIIEKGDGVIYFGFAACPWCRNAVPILLDAMSSTNLEKIYYVDLRPNDDTSKDIRTQYQVVENKVRRTRAASSERYDDVLEMLSDYLEDYIVTNDKGKEFETGKKYLGAPTVVAVKSGVVLDVHTSTVEGHNRVDGVLEDLTKEQKDNLYNIYIKLIGKYLDDKCDEDTSC